MNKQIYRINFFLICFIISFCSLFVVVNANAQNKYGKEITKSIYNPCGGKKIKGFNRDLDMVFWKDRHPLIYIKQIGAEQVLLKIPNSFRKAEACYGILDANELLNDLENDGYNYNGGTEYCKELGFKLEGNEAKSCVNLQGLLNKRWN